MQTTFDEIRSQPAVWRQAATLAGELTRVVPDAERVAFVGCGTSWFVAQAVATLREGLGHGESDAWAASEAPLRRQYDRVVAISRSGTTTEVVRLLADLPTGVRKVAVVAEPVGPVAAAADEVVALPFADERSVVQTRFATGVVAAFRARYGHDVERASVEAEALLRGADTPADLDALDLPAAARRFVFLGHDWTVGLAHEAALKLREAALASTESYPAMEYRHGPIALADDETAVWWLGADEAALVDEVARLGATTVCDGRDPLVSLVAVHLLALRLARGRGLDPDAPRNLTRSVVLEPAGGAR